MRQPSHAIQASISCFAVLSALLPQLHLKGLPGTYTFCKLKDAYKKSFAHRLLACSSIYVLLKLHHISLGHMQKINTWLRAGI